MKKLFMFLLGLLLMSSTLADRTVTLVVNPADNSLHTAWPDGTKPGDPDPQIGTWYIFPETVNTSENHTGSYVRMVRENGSEGAVQCEIYDTGTGTCTGGGDQYDTIAVVTKTFADGESGQDTDSLTSVTKNEIHGADCTIILGVQNCTTDFNSSPGAVTTLTLNVDNTDGSTGGSGEGGPLGWDNDDTEYGHRVVGGVCPDIPTTAADHTVNTEAELNTAMAALDGVGGIIEIEDGSYNWGDVTLSASGADDDNRIHIRAATHLGVDLGNVRFDITGEFITISRVEISPASGQRFDIRATADNLEVACIRYDGGGAALSASFFDIKHDTPDFVTDLEIRDSEFLDFDAPTGGSSWINMVQCNQRTNAGCTGVASRVWIHHNHIQGTNSQSGNATHYGRGYSPEDNSAPYPEPKNFTDSLWEHNHWEDWQGYNIHDLKSGGHIFRFNCFDNSRLPHFRKGHDILYVSNWHFDAQSSEGYLGSGWNHLIAFNYFEFDSNRAMFKFKIGQEWGNEPQATTNGWSYWSGSDGTYSYNVCDNCSSIIYEMTTISPLSTYPLIADNATVQGLSRDNTIENNKVRTATGSFSPADFYSGDANGYDDDATAFKAAQTSWSNNTVASSPKNSTSCFQSGFVDAHGDNTTTVPGKSTLPTFGGTVQTDDVIPAPSWWQ